MFAQLILPLNIKGTYTYKVPVFLYGKLAIGMRVVVPFGGKNFIRELSLKFMTENRKHFYQKKLFPLWIMKLYCRRSN